VRSPEADRAAAAKRTVEDLPFVPTTWIASSRSCGASSSSSSAVMRSSPSFIPNGASDSR
jgi:hypothetical protein